MTEIKLQESKNDADNVRLNCARLVIEECFWGDYHLAAEVNDGGNIPLDIHRKDSLTLMPRHLKENGFWMKFTPSSKTPRCAMTVAVYPDMKRIFMSG
jgi:hypothetical protein